MTTLILSEVVRPNVERALKRARRIGFKAGGMAVAVPAVVTIAALMIAVAYFKGRAERAEEAELELAACSEARRACMPVVMLHDDCVRGIYEVERELSIIRAGLFQ